ncbi:hypothetical protein D4R71_00380 [bacterium]|nr:MAG: hypothetical protein D4R71_00380 [bacterium]
MFETEKTGGVLIYAFCEWWAVDQEGKVDENGQYALINEMWIHKDYRGNGVLRRMLHKAAQKHPQIKDMYYQRRKYNDRQKQYSRKQLKEDI